MPRCEDIDSDDDTAQLIDPLTKHKPSANDANLCLSSSLGHLQLECVPEHSTELEEECAAGEVNDDDDDDDEALLSTAVHKSPAADTAAAAADLSMSDDGLEQCATDEHMTASVFNSIDMSAQVESKLFLLAICQPRAS